MNTLNFLKLEEANAPRKEPLRVCSSYFPEKTRKPLLACPSSAFEPSKIRGGPVRKDRISAKGGTPAMTQYLNGVALARRTPIRRRAIPNPKPQETNDHRNPEFARYRSRPFSLSTTLASCKAGPHSKQKNLSNLRLCLCVWAMTAHVMNTSQPTQHKDLPAAPEEDGEGWVEGSSANEDANIHLPHPPASCANASAVVG